MKKKNQTNHLRKTKSFWAVSMLLLGAIMVPLSVSAATDNEPTTVNVNLGSTISVASQGTVTINLTPTVGGAMTSAKDTVTVATNNATGYTLTLSSSDADTNLTNGSDTIPAHGGTQGSPTTLANNAWGYRVDDIGGFGAGPTSIESNVANTTYSWAGVPGNGSPNTIQTTASASASSETDVWFGVKADTSNPNGTYSDTVTYTATTNP